MFQFSDASFVRAFKFSYGLFCAKFESSNIKQSLVHVCLVQWPIILDLISE